MISVVLPTFNREVYLSRAIESVLTQTYRDFELIIIDDGSTDKTRSLVESYQDERMSYLYQENQGISLARNLGIEKAKGEWVAFLDSDDEWLPKKLEKQNYFSQNHSHIQIIHGDEIWIRNGVRVNPMKKHQKSGGWIFEKCLKLCLISPSAVMIKKELFSKVGVFDPEMTVCEDYDLWLRITSKFEVGYIDDLLLKKYGGHDDQLSRKFKAMDEYRVKSMINLLESQKINHTQRESVLDELMKKLLILKKGFIKHGHLEKAKNVSRLLEIYYGVS